MRTSTGSRLGVTSPPRPKRKPKRQLHQPTPSTRAHNWRFVSGSQRFECWLCGQFLLCKDHKDLPGKGCSGATPLGEARLLSLKHKPLYFECSNGQLFVVCSQCCATSTPVSAAKSGPIGECPGLPITQRAEHKFTKDILRGRYPQKKGVTLTRMNKPPEGMRADPSAKEKHGQDGGDNSVHEDTMSQSVELSRRL